MALAKDRNTQDSNNILLPACSYYDGAFDGVKSGSSSTIGFYGMDVYQKMVMEGGSVMVGGAGVSSNSSGDSQSVLEFHGGGDDWTYSSGSLLCFEQEEKNRSRFVEQEDHHELSDWADCVDISNAKWNHNIGSKDDGVDPRLSEKVNSFDTSNGYGGVEGRCLINKRPHLVSNFVPSDQFMTNLKKHFRISDQSCKNGLQGGEAQASKKHCTGASTNRKAKAKPTPAKDPQSVAAKVSFLAMKHYNLV